MDIPSYWAGYLGRSAFYSREYCHQLIGAHLLGLDKENFAMMKAFAISADASKSGFLYGLLIMMVLLLSKIIGETIIL